LRSNMKGRSNKRKRKKRPLKKVRSSETRQGGGDIKAKKKTYRGPLYGSQIKKM